MAPFVAYAPCTENESGHELINVTLQTTSGTIPAVFELNDNCGDAVALTLTFSGQSQTAKASSYFEALSQVRLLLEKDEQYPICWGSCESVYPSPMQLDMGNGRLAYKMALGCQAKTKDIVDIFNVDDICVPVTVAKQAQFHENWVQSIGKKNTGPSGEVL